MLKRVELVFFEGCPHADVARQRLRIALAGVKRPTAWTEVDIGVSSAPVFYRRFGSPTVLIDGVDISGNPESSGMGCVAAGAPSVQTIIASLLRE